ncbi:MAG: DUF2000 family protein [Chloroflexota bacterium]
MQFDTKIAIILRDDLATWQKLNVTAFISGALVGQSPDLIGDTYIDGSGQQYLPMIRQPIMIFIADAEKIRKTYERAIRREVRFALFTNELFATGNDVDNRQAVLAVKSEDLDVVGMALRDDKKTVDKIVKGLKLHG